MRPTSLTRIARCHHLRPTAYATRSHVTCLGSVTSLSNRIGPSRRDLTRSVDRQTCARRFRCSLVHIVWGGLHGVAFRNGVGAIGTLGRWSDRRGLCSQPPCLRTLRCKSDQGTCDLVWTCTMKRAPGHRVDLGPRARRPSCMRTEFISACGACAIHVLFATNVPRSCLHQQCPPSLTYVRSRVLRCYR